MQHSTFTPPRSLLLDCDGVLLDWIGGFTQYAQAILGRKLDPAGHTDFNLCGWLECTPEKLGEIIANFNGGDAGYFGRLEPLPGAREAIAVAHAQGRTLSIITACSTIPKVIAQREQNLRDVFGDVFLDVHTVDLAASKRDLLAQYKDVAWVEDKAENALLGAEMGLTSYLIRASHNAKHDGVMTHPRMTWVDGWDCIREHEGLH